MTFSSEWACIFEIGLFGTLGMVCRPPSVSLVGTKLSFVHQERRVRVQPGCGGGSNRPSWINKPKYRTARRTLRVSSGSKVWVNTGPCGKHEYREGVPAGKVRQDALESSTAHIGRTCFCGDCYVQDLAIESLLSRQPRRTRRSAFVAASGPIASPCFTDVLEAETLRSRI